MSAGEGGAALERALGVFVAAYERDAALVAEQRGWNLVIALAATDGEAEVHLSIADGVVVRAPEHEPPGLVVSAPLETLRDVLELRRDPNEPYLFGELTVTGAEADFLRLDYIASRLCQR